MDAAADLRQEVRLAVNRMVNHLKTLAEREPRLGVDSDDFNALLHRAKQAFPASRTIKEMNGFSGATTIGELMVKVSILEGAIVAEQVIE